VPELARSIFALVLAAACGCAGSAYAEAAADVPAEWLTPAEMSHFTATPSYDETLAFLRRLAGRSPSLKLAFYGKSAAGRPMPVAILSAEQAFEPGAAQRLAKPIVLIQNGIHSGEIDGKDACLMLLRDVALGRRSELLRAATLLVVPIYNVDGHERVSPWNRPNQDGPLAGMGFRATANGSDLNRDYLKAAAPETQALLGLFNAWRPHLFVDVHVTDGVDHDWVLTWAAPEAPQLAAPLDAWLREHLALALAATERAGHRTGPYVDLVDRLDPTKGFDSGIGEPRYSSGYLPLRHRPMVLVETQSHRPYEKRVLATRDFLAALVAEVGRSGAALRSAVAAAEADTVALGRADAAPSSAVVAWQPLDDGSRIRFPVYAWTVEDSIVTGKPFLRYRPGEVREIEVPWIHRMRSTRTVPRPRGYLVPPGWPQIEERLVNHGLHTVRLAQALELAVETQRISRPKFAEHSFQGLVRVEAEIARRVERRVVPAGALWVPADQPDFEVAIQLLEAEAPDSLFSWGFLSSILERKEWIDPWILEDEAKRQLASDPALARDWQTALVDPQLARDPLARAAWWYQRTRWYDEQASLLPVFRVLAPPAALLAAPR